MSKAQFVAAGNGVGTSSTLAPTSSGFVTSTVEAPVATSSSTVDGATRTSVGARPGGDGDGDGRGAHAGSEDCVGVWDWDWVAGDAGGDCDLFAYMEEVRVRGGFSMECFRRCSFEAGWVGVGSSERALLACTCTFIVM